MKTYKTLLLKFSPRVIKDDTFLDITKKVVHDIRTKNATPDEIAYIELLDTLINSYKNKDSNYVDTLNLNFYINWGIHTPEEQILQLYNTILELEDEGYEVIFSEGQEQRIRPVTYKPNLDINFRFGRDEVISGDEYNERIEKIIKDGYEEIVAECKKRNTKKIILLAYIYSSPRDEEKSNDVGVLVNFG